MTIEPEATEDDGPLAFLDMGPDPTPAQEAVGRTLAARTGQCRRARGRRRICAPGTRCSAAGHGRRGGADRADAARRTFPPAQAARTARPAAARGRPPRPTPAPRARQAPSRPRRRTRPVRVNLRASAPGVVLRTGTTPGGTQSIAALQPADQQFALVDHLRRQVVVQLDEQLLVLDHFAAATAPRSTRLQLVELLPREVQAASSRCPRSAASSRSASPCASARPCTRSTIHFSTRMFSPKPGQRNLPSSSLRNQLTWKIRGGSLSARCILSQCRK